MAIAPHISVRVSLSQFEENIRYLRALVAPTRLCVVLKADAYGHGLSEMAGAAARAGADLLGVCTNPEAAAIRTAGIELPLLRLRAALEDEYEQGIDLGIEEMLTGVEGAIRLSRLGEERGKPRPAHLMLDTGMGRGGIHPQSLDDAHRILQLPGIRVVGLMTHLANADAATLSDAKEQLEVFRELQKHLVEDGALPSEIAVHTHNSAATIRLPECRADLVRVGAACYGVRTSTQFDNPTQLQPVMTVSTRVAQVREVPAGSTIGYGSLFRTERLSRIASLPVGFGEGYARSLFNKGVVLVRGHRCPVVGRVSLNLTTVDVTDVPTSVEWGDEAVLVGRQGDDEITFEELADRFDSVHTELHLMFGRFNEIEYF